MDATEITKIPNAQRNEISSAQEFIIPSEIRTKCEVFSRVVGYYRPTINWNKGKMEEFKDRQEFNEQTCMCSEFAKAGKPTTDAVRK